MAFCQYVGTKGNEYNKRCVSKLNHEPAPHDLMPRSSATVRMIERQEEQERRLGDGPSTRTKESAPATESSAETTVSETTPETAAEPPAAGDPVSGTTTTTSETPGR